MAREGIIHFLFAALVSAFEQGGNLLAESEIRMAQAVRLRLVWQIRAENQGDIQSNRAKV